MGIRVEVIQLRIYVEGVLLPMGRGWGSFECTNRRGGRSSGSLVIPALPGVQAEDWARARVHAFWSDLDVRAAGTDWPLLFEGEIGGDAFQKSPSSRHLSFSLVGPEVYWDQCKLYFYSTDRSPVDQGDGNLTLETPKLALFFGNSQVETEGGAPGLTTQNRVLTMMQTAGAGKPFPGMVRRVFKDCLKSTNHFFARANQELKLDQRFAVARDDSVGLLYANSQLMFQQLEGNVGSRAASTPLREVLDDTLALFRYQMIGNMQPKLTTGDHQFRLRTDAERVRLTEAISQKVIDRFGESAESLGVTGASTNGELLAIAQSRTTDILTAANLAPHTLTDEEFALISDVSSTDADLNEENRRRIGSSWAFLIAVRDELARLAQPATDTDLNPLIPADEDQPADQLSQFILLPETDFALPPVCNVIFPTDSMAYSVARNHLSEPTRSVLSSPVVDNGIRKLYFAPESLKDAKIPTRIVRHVSVEGTFPPVTLGKVTSKFGKRQKPGGKDGEIAEHRGLDLRAAPNTEVFAFDDGVVIHADVGKGGINASGGIMVFIDHPNGTQTRYMHLNSVAVHPKQKVNAGELIGLSGATGLAGGTGPHLHFEYLVGGQRVNPEPPYVAALERYRSGESTEADQSTEVVEVTITEGVTNRSEHFDDFKYLTPEEEQKGIVPMFDTSMDKVGTSFARDDAQTIDGYLRQYTLASFQRSKYGSRPPLQMPMPFSPGVASGFPTLIVDSVRSIIGEIESITHRISVQGGVDASSVVEVSQPRFWNEGDPFYWRGGEAKFKPNPNTSSQVKFVPDASVARFPSFHLASLVATNSYENDPDKGDSGEPFGGKKTNRPIDDLYRGILGVPAIPYFFGESTSPVTGATRAFNKAIDGLDANGFRTPASLVGYYQRLMHQDEDLGHQFARNFTRRLGVNETELMVTFLKAERGDGGFVGGPFRDNVRAVVKRYVEILNGDIAFRG